MNIFSFIKSRLPILDVISEYTTLKKMGLYWKGICPFHHEKTPSFTVSPHKEIFYCFGCHEGGDLISFITKAEHCSPLLAVTYLAERYKIEIPDNLKQNHEAHDNHTEYRKRYWTLCQVVATWCHTNLLKNSTALQYLQKRGINRDLIKTFNLGLFQGGLSSIKSLTTFAQEHTFMAGDLIDAHIIAEGKTVLYSPFEDRIIFPIKDHLGNYCGFGGRIYKTKDERPKYVNSKENDYFLKGSLLFGLDQAKKAIQQEDSIFLVEGYTDCLAMVHYGFKNTVATLGTACTAEHLKQIARYASIVYVLYDGDKAGQNAMVRLTELCWNVNLELKIITLPAQEDPASFLYKDGNLGALIAQAQDIFVFFIETISKGFSTKNLNEKVNVIRTLIGVIEKLDDPLKKDLLLQRAAKTLDVPIIALKKELSRGQETPKTRIQPRDNSPDHDNSLYENKTGKVLKELPLLEKKIFSVIINNKNLLLQEDSDYLLEYLAPPLQDILKKLRETKGDAAQSNFIQFFDTLQESEKHLISQLVLECQEYEGPENFEYLLIQFQKKNWKSFVHDTKIKLSRAHQEHDEQTIKKIVNNFQEIKQKLIDRGLI